MIPSSSSAAEQLCRRFPLAEIKLATADFSDEQLIGKGGFGKVYKGIVDNGSTTVAMKRLASNSNQGEREFVTEIETLSKLRHHNLVSLIGYCNEKEQGEMILVYEYMPNGTLADHLHKLSSNNHVSSLTWNQRLKICIGAARGLDYLHTGTSIIHRDVKPSNILLDENFTSKVSDFGLAKYLSAHSSQTHVTTGVKGSIGYFDPSYFLSGRLTRESDTYAFGVVLLEVLCGRPAVDPRLAEGEPWMTMWALEKIRNGKANQIVALDLRDEIAEGSLKTFVRIAKRCLDLDPKKRLTMTQVVAQLEFAFEQQERKGPPRKLQIWPLNTFWNIFIPSGSTQKEAGEHTVNENEEEHNVNDIDDEKILVYAIPLCELKDNTNDFSSDSKLTYKFSGEYTFHGVLKSGQEAAITKLYNKLPEHEFLAQVSTMSSLKHENVVDLLGYCMESGVQALAFEVAPRGSLHNILHGQQHNGLEQGPGLSWAQRVEIAVGAAKGLLYVHENALIHHNIKSSNVLLFYDDIAKITNYQPTKFPCRAAFCDDPYPGTLHSDCIYHPPECKRFQSKKGDVYSFGVVLLELLTGQEVYDYQRRPCHLVEWANTKKLHSLENVFNFADARLEGDYSPSEVSKMAALAALCLQDEAYFRPDMSLILTALSRLNQTKPKLQNSQGAHATKVAELAIDVGVRETPNT